jgi:pimeloyl-ACP methyl ester carboxylesterase
MQPLDGNAIAGALYEIKVPVLIVNGQNDALLPPLAGPVEKLWFSGSSALLLSSPTRAAWSAWSPR